MVPAQGADFVSVPQALKTFSKNAFPAKKAHPTVNLMRKFFHTKLMSLARDETLLKQTMAALDGHSSGTIEKHYHLRDPAEDAELAKILVGHVFVELPEWPASEFNEEKAHELEEKLGQWALLDDEETDETQKDEVDEDMEYFIGGEAFGVFEPVVPIGDYLEKPLAIMDLADEDDDDDEVQEVPAQKKNRRYELDIQKGEWIKHDPNPNLIVHPATQVGKQLTLDEWNAQPGSSDENKMTTKDKKKKNKEDKAEKKRKHDKPEKVQLVDPVAQEKELGIRHRYRMTPEEHQWIERKAQSYKKKEGELPKTNWYADARKKGIESGKLSEFCTAEGLRSHIKGVLKKQGHL